MLSLKEYNEAFTYERMRAKAEKLVYENDRIEEIIIGKSLLGKEIPCLRIGKGSVNILYVGAIHGMEWITAVLLMRFAEDLGEFASVKRRIYGIDPGYIYEARSIYIIPMLNPDGVDICINGVDDKNPMRERLIKANNMSVDFSSWQANARGVDLNHNFNAGFSEYRSIEQKMGITGAAPTRYSGEYAESEPETQAICKLIRTVENFRNVMAFHTQGEEIYCDFKGRIPHGGKSMGNILARCSGYKIGKADGAAAYGGLKDWYIEEFDKPAFTIECGKGKNPLPIEQNEKIYIDIRKMLFRALIV